ncbi:hypothetical protein RR46_00111 [Papilio xuthus]|uniref:Uncharacterized protein n=1 Tax=Papilio xuthus TaxID=66420 RepID=A0A0N1PHQ5_PAPXU|nr:hypothetical protein RR46_00111 [Papilio xuthus]
MFQPARRGRGIAKNPRRPKILQGPHGDSELDVNAYTMPMACGTGQALPELNVELLSEGALHSGQVVQIQLDDNIWNKT